MRLMSVTVAGFRGFASKQKFDLSADATVVVGVNGLGKTSLLDAILWGLCGSVTRVGGDDRLVSLYSTTGEAQVSLVLKDKDGNELAVRRTTDGESQKIHVIDGRNEHTGGMAVACLCERLWPGAALANDANGILYSALTRSVYLQQDRVREFLDATTDQDRFSVISELVGTGRLTELQLQLDRQRTSWSKATNQIKREGEALELRVESLARQYERFQKSMSDDSSAPLISWENWWREATDLGVTERNIPSIDSIDANSILDVVLRDVVGLQDATQRRRTAAVALNELLSKEPKAPTASLIELREAFAKASAKTLEIRARLEKAKADAAARRQFQTAAIEAQEQLKALAQLAINLLAEKCPVCSQAIDVDQVRQRLIGLANTSEVSATSAPPIIDDVVALSELEKDAVTQEDAAKSFLRQAEERAVETKEWSALRDRRISELRIQWDATSNLKDLVTSIVSECDQRLMQLEQVRRTGETLSLQIGRELNRSRIGGALSDLNTAKKELAIHQAVVAAREATGARATLLLDELREASAKVAVDKLNEIEPFLQRIYARIDPHPTFRIVRFVSRLSRGRGRLDAELHDRHNKLSSNSPAAVLSSSQLNALAVSIFLSFNLALPRLPIDVALLDDPIQSLDDINLLGMVDLLRRTKDKRQLIVSTHDERFGRLLERKLRPADADHRTSIIQLSGWTRSGPTVQQYEVQAEAVRLRMARGS